MVNASSPNACDRCLSPGVFMLHTSPNNLCADCSEALEKQSAKPGVELFKNGKIGELTSVGKAERVIVWRDGLGDRLVFNKIDCFYRDKAKPVTVKADWRSTSDNDELPYLSDLPASDDDVMLFNREGLMVGHKIPQG